MTGRGRDPLAAWAEVSARAAHLTGYRPPVRSSGPRFAAAASAGLLTVGMILVASVLALRQTAPAAPSPSPAVETPVSATVDDGAFRISLTTPRALFTANDAIEPVAAITYLGPDPAVQVSHATRPVSFSIQEVGGPRSMDGGSRLACVSTILNKDQPVSLPFVKSGSPDEPENGFDIGWYRNPTLRLPAGTWRITATLDVYTAACGGAKHVIADTNEVSVTAAAPNADPVVRRVDDGTFRFELASDHGVYRARDPIATVATVTYLGPHPTETIWHAASPVYFTIEEVGGDRQMDGAMSAPCIHTELTRDVPVGYPFGKSGSIGKTFDRAWFDDPLLHLPAGTWRIRAALGIETSDGTSLCGGVGHGMDLDNIITVVDDGALPSRTPGVTASAAATPTPSIPDEPRSSPVVNVPPAEDGTFRLEVEVPKSEYTTTEAIKPVATLTYLGPLDVVEYGHSDPAVFFMIQQLDGDAQMTGGGADSCTLTPIRRGEPVQVPFRKAGQTGLGFDEGWFQGPVLRLPPGTWRIAAQFEAGIPACEIGAQRYELRAQETITVR
jgi:hypothetical protein